VIRVLSEALTNAEKHARARSVLVSAERRNGWLELRVCDDGRGFDLAAGAAPADGHLGLDLMRRRAEDAGGTLDLSSSPGAGTTVTLRLATHGDQG
jgi:signal transduction histidine kinase